MDRTSSPRTYSRRESNSVPCPRTWTLVLPSSSRSRASRDGRCRRDVNGGRTRMLPATASRALRPAMPRGPAERTANPALRSSPRRRGSREVTTRPEPPGSIRITAVPVTAPAVGCHASRTRIRRARVPVLTTVAVTCAGWSRSTFAGPERVMLMRWGSGAATTSMPNTSRQNPSQPAAPAHAGMPPTEPRMTGRAPAPTRRGYRPVTYMRCSQRDARLLQDALEQRFD